MVVQTYTAQGGINNRYCASTGKERDNKQNKIIQFFEQIQNRMVTHISFRVGALKCPTGEYITTYI
jgi:hypothetical protein